MWSNTDLLLTVTNTLHAHRGPLRSRAGWGSSPPAAVGHKQPAPRNDQRVMESYTLCRRDNSSTLIVISSLGKGLGCSVCKLRTNSSPRSATQQQSNEGLARPHNNKSIQGSARPHNNQSVQGHVNMWRHSNGPHQRSKEVGQTQQPSIALLAPPTD